MLSKGFPLFPKTNLAVAFGDPVWVSGDTFEGSFAKKACKSTNLFSIMQIFDKKK